MRWSWEEMMRLVAANLFVIFFLPMLINYYGY